jgi:hypothetical protein
VLSPLEESPYLAHEWDFFGGRETCLNTCLNYAGKVTSVKLPFSWDQMENSQHQIALSLKKNQSLGETIKTQLAKIKDALGLSGELDLRKQIAMEKHIAKVKSKAESMKIDTSLYFLTDIANTFFNVTGTPLTLNDYFQTINFMTHLNREGKLPLFFDLYLAIKAKDFNNPLYQKYLCSGLEFLFNDNASCNQSWLDSRIQLLEKYKGKKLAELVNAKELAPIEVYRYAAKNNAASLSDLITPVYRPSVYRITGQDSEYYDPHKLFTHFYKVDIKSLNLDRAFNYTNDMTIKISKDQLDKRYTEYIQGRNEHMEKGKGFFRYILLIVLIGVVVYFLKRKRKQG